MHMYIGKFRTKIVIRILWLRRMELIRFFLKPGHWTYIIEGVYPMEKHDLTYSCSSTSISKQ